MRVTHEVLNVLDGDALREEIRDDHMLPRQPERPRLLSGLSTPRTIALRSSLSVGQRPMFTNESRQPPAS